MMQSANKSVLRQLIPHLLMAFSCIIWGLMAPLGKHAMTHGIDGFAMVFLRVSGAALCFWITSLLLTIRRSAIRHRWDTGPEAMSLSEIALFAIAAVFGITCNQCCFTIGLSLTSPINASILTTTLPIFALLIGALFFQRAVTWRNGSGIVLGLIGAIVLILGSVGGINSSPFQGAGGSWVSLGDLLVIGAQCSFAIYLNTFQSLLKRHSVITIQKWMMTFATFYVLPIAWPHLVATDWLALTPRVIAEAMFVVIFGTYIAYITMTKAQQQLQPTVIAMYNYVQPIVACIVSVWLGIGHFGLMQLMAILFVFTGVWLVTQSRSGSKKEKAL